MTPQYHNPAICVLGKGDPKPPRLMVAKHVDIERLGYDAPDQVNNSLGQTVPLGMYLNSSIGDCVLATVGNTLRVNSRGQRVLHDNDVLDAYIAVTAKENGGQGYDPATGANDNGTVELDALDYWTNPGVGGNRILGHAGVNYHDLAELKTACYLFGSVFLGLALAVEQQQQQVWDHVPGSTPGSWGLHAVPLFDANVTFVVPGVWVSGTWAAYKAMTPAFVQNQLDEAHVTITQEWVDANQANSAVNLDALLTDLKQLTPES